MASKQISEVTAKGIIYRKITRFANVPDPIRLCETDNFQQVVSEVPWVQNSERFVIKLDRGVKRRGKNGLVYCGTLQGCEEFFNKNKGMMKKVGKVEGRLSQFIVDPFVEHDSKEEQYLCIYSERDNDVILFHESGGVEVGDVDTQARRLKVPIQLNDNEQNIDEKSLSQLVGNVPNEKKNLLSTFIKELYDAYKSLHFTYLEINPLVICKDTVYVLDVAAKLDETATYICSKEWKTRSGLEVEFPAPFGRELTEEEKYIADLDARTGASLKLTILNKKGRIWTMVAGGGASVVYTDTICDLGGAEELANYGEYSGDPNETQTFEYAKTVLQLMTSGEPNPKGKVLIIAGSIANFTNVATTFKGIIRALETYASKLRDHNVNIYVRRGGPNYQGGLRKFEDAAKTLKLPIHLFGPETHITSIVKPALGQGPLPQPALATQATAEILLDPVGSTSTKKQQGNAEVQKPVENVLDMEKGLLGRSTKAIVWGQQQKAIQGMLDFDYVCRRETPSVVAATYPFSPDHKQKYYFGQHEILIPSYKTMASAFAKQPDASVLITFASMRSVFDTVIEALDCKQIKVIAIIAEGVPENLTRKIIKTANEKAHKPLIIGPATVGGIKPGCFKIGNTGGMMDNILASKLYRPGSVAYVSRSGGMSNELNNIISHNTDGVFEGVAIGGDRYPGSTYMDHIMRYEQDPGVKMIVLLGEVGGIEEYKIVEALKAKRITKPLVAWCIGTCADYITSEVQFGHAGASANAAGETAASKNKALKAAGARVPQSFDDFGNEIATVYNRLVKEGVVVPRPEQAPPPVPMDFEWAKELGLIRKPASFMTSICDERGDELLYAGVPISRILENNIGIGGVIGLLWFQRRLPGYANQFIELCIMMTADHGPAVSGAHNTIVCARAGKDLISSLTSGLLTIGDRFGGALDGAARMFSEAIDKGLDPITFVNEMRTRGEHIPGIGHRVKSTNNPDKRVEILKSFAMNKANFKQETPLLNYALKVEKITTSKKPNLILNVDGAIGVIFVDILRHSGMFTLDEANNIIQIGALNALFVLGRSIGFIGHYLDQRRLNQGLYRHPWDDISYVMPEQQFE